MNNERKYEMQLNPSREAALFMGVLAVIVAILAIVYAVFSFDLGYAALCSLAALFVGAIGIELIRENTGKQD